MKRKTDRPLSKEVCDVMLSPGARAFRYANPLVVLSAGVIRIIEETGGDPAKDIDIDVFIHRALNLWKMRRFRGEGEMLDGILFECGGYRFQARTVWRNEETVVSFSVPSEKYPEIL